MSCLPVGRPSWWTVLVDCAVARRRSPAGTVPDSCRVVLLVVLLVVLTDGSDIDLRRGDLVEARATLRLDGGLEQVVQEMRPDAESPAA